MDNYYEILGVEAGDSTDVVKKAIRDRRREWRNKSNHPKAETRAIAEGMIERIAEAEQVLLDSASRADYDRKLTDFLNSPQAKEAPAAGGRNWLDSARSYLAQGQAQQASYAAREATQAQPQNPEAWYVRGAASVALGQFADAEFELSEAIGLDPKMHEAHHQLGDVYERHDQWDKAERCYGRAAELLPGSPFYEAELGHVRTRQGKHEEGLKLLEKVVKEKPDQDLYRLYLADALLVEAMSKMSSTGDDGVWTITTDAQLQVANETMRRVRALNVKGKDRGFDEQIDEWARLTERLGSQRWHHSDHLVLWIGGVVVLFFTMMTLFGAGQVFLGLLAGAALAGLGYLYYQRHYVMGWQQNRRDLPGYIVRSGLQDPGRM